MEADVPPDCDGEGGVVVVRCTWVPAEAVLPPTPTGEGHSACRRRSLADRRPGGGSAPPCGADAPHPCQ
jgi:hypothetical protein